MLFSEFKSQFETMIQSILCSLPIGLSKTEHQDASAILDFYFVSEQARRMGRDIQKPLYILSRILAKLELVQTEYSLFRKLWLTRLLTILVISIGARLFLNQISESAKYPLISNVAMLFSLIGFIGATCKGISMSTFKCWFYEKGSLTLQAIDWWKFLNCQNNFKHSKQFPKIEAFEVMESQKGVDCHKLRFDYLMQMAELQTMASKEDVQIKIDRMPLVELGLMLPLSILMNLGPILEFIH